MLDKYNTKGKIILFLVFTGLSGALVLGFVAVPTSLQLAGHRQFIR